MTRSTQPSLQVRTMRGTWTTGCLAGWTFQPTYSCPLTERVEQGENPSQPTTPFLLQETSYQTRGVKRLAINRNLPVWRPLRLASFLKVTRAREWTTAGFLIIKPSRWRREMLRRELARAISLISLGSNQILRFPHFNTEAARRFWSLRETANERN